MLQENGPRLELPALEDVVPHLRLRNRPKGGRVRLFPVPGIQAIVDMCIPQVPRDLSHLLIIIHRRGPEVGQGRYSGLFPNHPVAAQQLVFHGLLGFYRIGVILQCP
jgi:hypothetical protein